MYYVLINTLCINKAIYIKLIQKFYSFNFKFGLFRTDLHYIYTTKNTLKNFVNEHGVCKNLLVIESFT